MSQLTLDDLRRILETSSGVVEQTDWTDPATLDAPFDDLGYDSLALLELAARVQQEYEVRIPDDAVSIMKTPRLAVDYVNQRLADR
ncbi:phosphopantetheine-binding protein [Micromonospora vinacea]|uniref:acyl carrier protein n=1 Tax=Micromonospora vinacea TaxID=709878 RepID=UPI00344EFABF